MPREARRRRRLRDARAGSTPPRRRPSGRRARPTRGSGLGAAVDMLAGGRRRRLRRRRRRGAAGARRRRAGERERRSVQHFDGTERGAMHANRRWRVRWSRRSDDPERERGEHLLHARDLGGLIDVDVGGELEDGLVLRRRRRSPNSSFTIDDGAAVVLDHEGEEEPVELRRRAPRRAASSASSVSMPGMSISCSMPSIIIFIGPGVRLRAPAGRRSRSQLLHRARSRPAAR